MEGAGGDVLLLGFSCGGKGGAVLCPVELLRQSYIARHSFSLSLISVDDCSHIASKKRPPPPPPPPPMMEKAPKPALDFSPSRFQEGIQPCTYL